MTRCLARVMYASHCGRSQSIINRYVPGRAFAARYVVVPRDYAVTKARGTLFPSCYSNSLAGNPRCTNFQSFHSRWNPLIREDFKILFHDFERYFTYTRLSIPRWSTARQHTALRIARASRPPASLFTNSFQPNVLFTIY